MARSEHDEDELTLWRSTVDRLLRGGAKPHEALEGANLILAAYRRRQSEIRLRVGVEPPRTDRASNDDREPPRKE
jgi:hypothetical protein